MGEGRVAKFPTISVVEYDIFDILGLSKRTLGDYFFTAHPLQMSARLFLFFTVLGNRSNMHGRIMFVEHST